MFLEAANYFLLFSACGGPVAEAFEAPFDDEFGKRWYNAFQVQVNPGFVAVVGFQIGQPQETAPLAGLYDEVGRVEIIQRNVVLQNGARKQENLGHQTFVERCVPCVFRKGGREGTIIVPDDFAYQPRPQGGGYQYTN